MLVKKGTRLRVPAVELVSISATAGPFMMVRVLRTNNYYFLGVFGEWSRVSFAFL